MFYLRLLNIPHDEWYLSDVGELFDMIACWQIMHGAKAKEAEPEAWEVIAALE